MQEGEKGWGEEEVEGEGVADEYLVEQCSIEDLPLLLPLLLLSQLPL